MRVVLLLPILLFAVACGGSSIGSADPAGVGGSAGAGAERPCTMIGAPAGIRVDIAAGLPADHGSIEVCWDGSCQTFPVELFPATEAGPTTCTGDGPNEVCSAQAQETGGQYSFVDIPELPGLPVRTTLTVNGGAGEQLARHTVDVVPEPVYPNGPDCDSGGPQARLVVDDQGQITVG